MEQPLHLQIARISSLDLIEWKWVILSPALEEAAFEKVGLFQSVQ
jgi:hypothetical protein